MWRSGEPSECCCHARGMDLNEFPETLGARAPNGNDPRIDGLVPSLVLEPEDGAATAEALTLCHQESMGVIPIGGGTRLELGNVPSRLDAYLMTSGLKGIEIDEHIPGDFTMAVRAGTTLGETQRYLKEFRQYVPLDVPHPDEATIGGIFALGEPGQRRRPGARPRDLLLGFEGVLADGTPFKAGGRVVKNVAGYELMKLFVGSAGTLAVMTRAFLRLRALPEEVTTVVIQARRPRAVAAAWRELRNLPLAPEMAVALSPTYAESHGLHEWNLLLRFEGLHEETRGALHDVRQRFDAEVLPDDRNLWDAIRDFPKSDAALVLRGQAAPARTIPLAESWQDGGALIAYPDTGIVYSQTTDPEALSDRRARAEENGAAVVIEKAPLEMKRELDVYGETPGGYEIMRRIKEKLDPKNILSPGRFVGKI
ncbi:MAG: FAD-binding oxidoreductase [Acidobacteria bacterium]|nr:MAG: FAD-binding oxidoreductase [Acidobacteriota bacterium]